MSGVNHWIDTANVSDIDKGVLIFLEMKLILLSVMILIHSVL